jgi:putative ABC transport system permease protein
MDLNDALKQTGRGAASGAGSRLRNILSGAEIALATVLLIGAGLLIRSFANLERVRLGFESRGLITFQLSPPPAKYPTNATTAVLYRALIDALQSLPGVRSAAVSSGIPFGNGTYSTHPMASTGASVLPPGTLVPIDWRIVSPGYFATMKVPLLRGRDFTDADGTAAPVMIVSQSTAKKFWGDADPIGRVLRRSADLNTSFTVIGVVGDVRSTALNQESPALYYPMSWRTWPLMDVVARTDGAPKALLPGIRQKIHELDAELALANVRTMDEWISNSAAQPRLNAALLGAFAAGALLLAAIGIYGVLSYSVSQRTQEIGLRMALGELPAGVLRLVIGEGLKVGVTGIAIGVAGGLALGRTVSSLVYGVAVYDPVTFIGVASLLLTVALAACAIPARRAARVDPLIALRHD